MDITDRVERIMYVDDDAEDRLLFQDALEEIDGEHGLQTATDGLDALEQLKRTDHVLPGLVVIDLNMPRMGGKELIRKVRENPELAHLKLVVLTTSASSHDIAECKALGVDMHTKPGTFDELKNTVALLLSQY